MKSQTTNLKTRTGAKLVALFAAGSLIAAACGSDDPAALPNTDTTSTSVESAMADMLGAFGPACGAVPTSGEGSFAGMADDTAATAASNNPLLSTLVTAVVEADLVDTLNSDGPFTIFAPTNDAFAAIPEDILNAVLADKDLLTSVLTYHVVGGESLAADALGSAGSKVTVETGELSFGSDGTTVNDVDVICSNVPVSNGTVHIIDQVLLPQVALDAIAEISEGSMDEGSMDDVEGAMADIAPIGDACAAVPTSGEGSFAGMADDTAATAASNNPLLSTLVTAVVEADLVDTLNSDGPFTIFAPVNDAFAAISEADLNALLADKAALTDVLTFHVVSGEKMDVAALASAGTVQTVNGGELNFAANGDSVTINGSANVICGNVPTANATVHIIDSVLLPQG